LAGPVDFFWLEFRDTGNSLSRIIGNFGEFGLLKIPAGIFENIAKTPLFVFSTHLSSRRQSKLSFSVDQTYYQIKIY